jgi:hypothetical protein
VGIAPYWYLNYAQISASSDVEPRIPTSSFLLVNVLIAAWLAS